MTRSGKPLPRAESDALVFDAGGGLPRLIEIMARLRDPDTGCPWDIEQNYASIAPYTIEEAYEVADAIDRADFPDLEGELGDLLLQVIYFTQMGAEDGHFDFASVTKGVADKMVARHPHIFGDESRDKSAEQQTADWEQIKAAERASKAQTRVLDGVALGLPGLTRAIKLQKRAARVGFDWTELDHVLAKLTEEVEELADAKDPVHQHEEFGDILFVMANVARHLKIDPEQALRDANAKFTRRFNAIEDALEAEGRHPKDATLEEMDALWDAQKRA